MDQDSVIGLTSQALVMVMIVSMPVVIVSAVVGLLVSFGQTITSLQDASISQAAKLIAVVIALVVSAPWGSAMLLDFARKLVEAAFQ
jgi:type III secretion protein S